MDTLLGIIKRAILIACILYLSLVVEFFSSYGHILLVFKLLGLKTNNRMK